MYIILFKKTQKICLYISGRLLNIFLFSTPHFLLCDKILSLLTSLEILLNWHPTCWKIICITVTVILINRNPHPSLTRKGSSLKVSFSQSIYTCIYLMWMSRVLCKQKRQRQRECVFVGHLAEVVISYISSRLYVYISVCECLTILAIWEKGQVCTSVMLLNLLY